MSLLIGKYCHHIFNLPYSKAYRVCLQSYLLARPLSVFSDQIGSYMTDATPYKTESGVTCNGWLVNFGHNSEKKKEGLLLINIETSPGFMSILRTDSAARRKGLSSIMLSKHQR